MDQVLFQITLKRRLRLRVQATDTFCPMCGSTMDSFGDHALTCSCKGDRTVRHNRLRDIVHEEAARGGLSPEKEKQEGLLPARPLEDGLRVQDGSGTGVTLLDNGTDPSRRRPADVFLPRGMRGARTALDFACTSGLRADRLRQAADNPESIVLAYEQAKRDFTPPGERESTQALCSQQDLSFVPMIVEAHGGGWSKTARQVLDLIAKHVEAATGLESEVASLEIAQRLSITLQRENARAVLRRISEVEAGSAESEWPLADEPSLW